MADNEVNDDIDSLFEEDDKPTAQAVAEAPVDTPAPEVTPEVVPEEGDKDPETPEVTPPETSPVVEEVPAVEEPAKPLSAEEVRAIMAEVRDQERNSAKVIDEAEKEVLSAYYPQGLSNTLIDESTGKEIKSPQDVVDLSNGTMTTEEATQWLLNEQYKLDKQVAEIKSSARELAEVNHNFKQGAVRVLETYKDVFDKFPGLQTKVYKNYMKTVKMDTEKDLVLTASDIEEYYRDFMEPYVMAASFKGSAPAGVPAPAATPPPEQVPAPSQMPVSKQTAKDRMDVTGDGGVGNDNKPDPNDPNATLNDLFGE
jgi:hypothetical protein